MRIDYPDGSYEDDFGLFDADGRCLAEFGSDADFDTYFVEVQNGDGYYNAAGRFVRYRDEY